MKEFSLNLLATFVLLLLLSVEKIFGQPLLFFAGVLLIYSKRKDWTQVLISLLLGLILSVYYLLPLWSGPAIIGVLFLGFGYLSKIISSHSLRLLMMVILESSLMFYLIKMPFSWQVFLYQLLLFMLLCLFLLFIAGVGFRTQRIRMSERLK